MSEARVPKIAVRGVEKSFGPKRVLDGLDIECGAGESLVIIGGSGTGKSVLIKCILGLLRPERGSIRIDGVETVGMRRTAREPLMRKFGMLFQGAALFDSLKVWENVAFGLIQGRGVARDEARSIAIDKLAAVGLGADVGELSPAELSGGMQKRVGLARAIAAEPEIIFFDEPTTGLDPIMTDVINELILQTQRTKKATGVVVTHEMKTVAKVADRVVMLYPLARLEPDEPQMIYDGPPEGLEDHPDKRIRQFVRGEAGERLRELSQGRE